MLKILARFCLYKHTGHVCWAHVLFKKKQRLLKSSLIWLKADKKRTAIQHLWMNVSDILFIPTWLHIFWIPDSRFLTLADFVLYSESSGNVNPLNREQTEKQTTRSNSGTLVGLWPSLTNSVCNNVHEPYKFSKHRIRVMCVCMLAATASTVCFWRAYTPRSHAYVLSVLFGSRLQQEVVLRCRAFK